MRSIASFPLWIGNAADRSSPRSWLDAEVEAVVDLADNEPPLVMPRGLVSLRFPILDGNGNPRWILRAVLRSLDEAIRASVPTLVCCSAGMSRSPALVAGAIALATGDDPARTLALVASSGAVDVSPGLWHDVVAVVSDLRGHHL